MKKLVFLALVIASFAAASGAIVSVQAQTEPPAPAVISVTCDGGIPNIDVLVGNTGVKIRELP